jgi:aminoglycoside phosphotransferase family enzyme/predicted kinase
MSVVDEQATLKLVGAICDRPKFDHPVENIRVIETHISYVLLTGAFAYKIKKPVSLGFADFSTLERRRATCYEEVRLNRRLAPKLYIGVVPIGGSVEAPVVNEPGVAIEYAVKMRQFPDAARLDDVVKRDGLNNSMVRALAAQVADFHSSVEVSQPSDTAQRSEHRFSEVADNFEALNEFRNTPARSTRIAKLRDWSMESLVVNGDQLRRRRREGFVRECHGDMHLANMALFDDEIVVFDALEFNADLRWADVMSEVAFVVMDFIYHARPDLASVFLSNYLQATNDYDGLTVLRHFLVYRAMVRAKVSAIRSQQQGVDDAARKAALDEMDEHLRLAMDCRRFAANPMLLITFGPSGTGKSTISARLLGSLNAIHIRSDVERRRRGLPRENHYSASARHRTYARLETCADKILQAGFPVIVDATFIRQEHRERFWRLANDHGIPFGILAVSAPRDVLAKRIALREAEKSDVSEATAAVLDQQLEESQQLTPAEREFAIEIDTSADLDFEGIERFLRRTGRLPLEHRFHRQGWSGPADADELPARVRN